MVIQITQSVSSQQTRCLKSASRVVRSSHVFFQTVKGRKFTLNVKSRRWFAGSLLLWANTTVTEAELCRRRSDLRSPHSHCDSVAKLWSQECGVHEMCCLQHWCSHCMEEGWSADCKHRLKTENYITGTGGKILLWNMQYLHFTSSRLIHFSVRCCAKPHSHFSQPLFQLMMTDPINLFRLTLSSYSSFLFSHVGIQIVICPIKFSSFWNNSSNLTNS